MQTDRQTDQQKDIYRHT